MLIKNKIYNRLKIFGITYISLYFVFFCLIFIIPRFKGIIFPITNAVSLFFGVFCNKFQVFFTLHTIIDTLLFLFVTIIPIIYIFKGTYILYFLSLLALFLSFGFATVTIMEGF